MAAYVQITSGEMAEFMSALGFQELSVRERTPERMLKQSRAVKESVFEKPVGAGKIRIYSTVQGGQGRKVGQDAIRVQYWVDGVKVYGATRVHRVTNWRKNLLNRIYEIEDMVSTGALRQVPKDSSGRPMVVRSARRDKSKFWGSSDYPRNRETRRFESAVIMPKKPTTAVEKAVMWKRAIEIADLQYMMMELENQVKMGIISEEELMKSLHEKFGAEEWQDSDGTWVVNDEIEIATMICDECDGKMKIDSIDYDKRVPEENMSVIEIIYVCHCSNDDFEAEYTTVANSPLGEIVTDVTGNRFVLINEELAQIIFEQSAKSFAAEWREEELLYPEEIESLMAIGSPESKVFYAVRVEGNETQDYIVQEERIDEDLMYRILLILEEEPEPVETFASAVDGYGKTTGGLDEIDQMLNRRPRKQNSQERITELQQENERMRALIREGRAVYTRNGWVEVEQRKDRGGNVSWVKVPVSGDDKTNSKFLQKRLNAEDRDMEERMTRVEAEALADKLITALEPYVDYSEVCGSFRRGREDPGDLDVVIIMKPGESLPEIIDKLSGLYTAINWLGEKKTQIIVDGVKVDIKVSNPEGIGAALLYFTGPSGYNIGMRSAAKRKGLKLNEYGLFNRDTNEYLGGATEEEIYDLLGRTYKPPEMRAEQVFQSDYERVTLRAALEDGLRKLAKKGYVVAAPPYGNKSRSFYIALSEIMMQELAKLETGTTGPTVSGTGVVQSPLDVVAALARGDSMPKTPTASATSEPSVMGIAEMVSSFTKQATIMDNKAGKGYVKQTFDLPNYTVKRLAWPISRAMGIFARCGDKTYDLFSTPQKNANCSMIVNMLVEDTAPEVKGLTDNEKEAFYQEFGDAIKESVFAKTKDSGQQLKDEQTKQRKWAQLHYGKRESVSRVSVSQKIKDKAQTAAEKLNPFAAEEEEELLDDDEYWEPYMEAVEEYWRMCHAYVNEAGESYQGMVQHINFWQEVAEASSHSLNYVLEKAWKFKYDALRMIYNGDAVSGHEWVLEQMSQKDYELLEDFNPENRDYDGEYVFTNYSPGVPTLTWLKDNLNPWYLSREEGKPYAFDLYR